MDKILMRNIRKKRTMDFDISYTSKEITPCIRSIESRGKWIKGKDFRLKLLVCHTMQSCGSVGTDYHK